MLIAYSRLVESYVYPLLVFSQSIPKVAIAPLFVIWFGLGMTSKVVNSALVAFFPLLVNTIVGLRSADEDRVSLMRSLVRPSTVATIMPIATNDANNTKQMTPRRAAFVYEPFEP